VLDPFAGGGSIPFEALRYGFTTIRQRPEPGRRGDPQGDAWSIRRALGPLWPRTSARWGELWAQRVEARLAPYFPKLPGESIFAYLWARTVA
jgi:putative DNA methylase